MEALAVGIRHSISGTFSHEEGITGDGTTQASPHEIPNQLEFGNYLTVPGSNPLLDPKSGRKAGGSQSSTGGWKIRRDVKLPCAA